MVAHKTSNLEAAGSSPARNIWKDISFSLFKGLGGKGEVFFLIKNNTYFFMFIYIYLFNKRIPITTARPDGALAYWIFWTALLWRYP